MRILRIFFTHPSAIMGYIYGKILAVFLGATKALNVKVDWISLAEKRNGKVPLESRRYSNSNCFPQQSTRFIMLEISIKKVRWQPNRLYEVTFRIYSKFDGRLLNEQRFDPTLTAASTFEQVTEKH